MKKGSATPYYYQSPGDHRTTSRLVAFILILIFSAIIGWFNFQEKILPFNGIHGVATEVDLEQNTILLEDAEAVGRLANSFGNINRFTVHLNEETAYYAYAEEKDMLEDASLSANISSIKAGQKILIGPREKAGNVITALEVRILPQ